MRQVASEDLGRVTSPTYIFTTVNIKKAVLFRTAFKCLSRRDLNFQHPVKLIWSFSFTDRA